MLKAMATLSRFPAESLRSRCTSKCLARTTFRANPCLQRCLRVNKHSGAIWYLPDSWCVLVKIVQGFLLWSSNR
jgi:hypothetical protein